jgi:hypothetical protein
MRGANELVCAAIVGVSRKPGLARAVQILLSDAAPASGAPPTTRRHEEEVMFSRILFSTIAASLLTAAPAFAAEAATVQQCSCCSDGSIHDVDHPLREQAPQKKTSTERASQPRTTEDDPDVRNQSWGG